MNMKNKGTEHCIGLLLYLKNTATKWIKETLSQNIADKAAMIH